MLSSLTYTDPQGQPWFAPIGTTSDGASIPQFAWSFTGGPYEGLYREAAFIHDVACEQKTKAWAMVHRTFYTAMRARGVGEMRAKLMYAAVYHFGPRWPDPLTHAPAPTQTLSDAGFEQLTRSIQGNAPHALPGGGGLKSAGPMETMSLEEIENFSMR